MSPGSLRSATIRPHQFIHPRSIFFFSFLGGRVGDVLLLIHCVCVCMRARDTEIGLKPTQTVRIEIGCMSREHSINNGAKWSTTESSSMSTDRRHNSGRGGAQINTNDPEIEHAEMSTLIWFSHAKVLFDSNLRQSRWSFSHPHHPKRKRKGEKLNDQTFKTHLHETVHEMQCPPCEREQMLKYPER